MPELFQSGERVRPREALTWLVRLKVGDSSSPVSHHAVIEGNQFLTMCGRWFDRSRCYAGYSRLSIPSCKRCARP